MTAPSPCVLFVAERFAPSVGGQQSYNLHLHEQLQRHVPTVLARPERYWPLDLHRLVFGPQVLLTCRRLAAATRVTHVHASSARVAPLSWLAARRLGARLSASVHGLDVTLVGKLPLYRWLVPWALRRCEAVVCNSRATRSQALCAGLSPSRCHVVPCGVDAARHRRSLPRAAARARLSAALGISADGPTLGLTVGRQIRRKGLAWFAEQVLPLLPDDYVHLAVGQEGEESARIAALAARPALAGRLRVVSNAADALRDLAYDAADVFVMPNVAVPGHREGFGLVLLEAGMHGLPVVASDLEGIPDAVVPGITGLLAPPANAPAFRDAVLAVRQWPDTERRLPEAVIARFSWERLYHTLAGLLELPCPDADRTASLRSCPPSLEEPPCSSA